MRRLILWGFGVTLRICVIGLYAAGPATAQTAVAGNKLTSTQFPSIVMEFDAGLEYIASSEFILYDVAETVIHIFGEPEEKQVRRLYWIQFEGYLPDVNRTYDYSDSQGLTEISGHQYYENCWFWNLDSIDIRAGSDTEHVLKLLDDHDLVLGPEVIGLRLVRLDDERRNELMLVYLEDPRAKGLSSKDLSGPDRTRVVEGLRMRAIKGIHIEERRQR